MNWSWTDFLAGYFIINAVNFAFNFAVNFGIFLMVCFWFYKGIVGLHLWFQSLNRYVNKVPTKQYRTSASNTIRFVLRSLILSMSVQFFQDFVLIFQSRSRCILPVYLQSFPFYCNQEKKIHINIFLFGDFSASSHFFRLVTFKKGLKEIILALSLGGKFS